MAFPELVSTARLTLRRWRAPEHTEALAAVNAEPDAVRFLNAGVPFTPEESAVQSERFAAHWERHGFGLWAIEAEGQVAGFTGVCHPGWFPEYAHEFVAGWRLHPSVWGKGYATEAGRVALAAAFEHLEAHRVVALVDEGNDASTAVALRLGMTLDHTVADPHGPGLLLVYAVRP